MDQSVAPADSRNGMFWKTIGLPVAGLILWFPLYWSLPSFSRLLTYGWLGLPQGGRLTGAVEFFAYESPKVILLLLMIVFAMGVVRSFFAPEKVRRYLAGGKLGAGYVLAVLLGVVTPFCSCSAVPLFIGFVTAGVPLGVTFSFLVSAPMVNEVALVLLFGLFGWKVAAVYLATGLSVALVSGLVIGLLKMEGQVEPWVYRALAAETAPEGLLTWSQRIGAGKEAVRDIVGKVWPYVLAGILVGAGIHGYVPENSMASLMGRSAWWSVPAAVLLGVPLYSNAAGMIPVMQALLSKGAALGTALAFMMSVTALSLPEAVILRKVLRPRLIAVFAGVVASGILLVGYLFNWIF